MTLTEAQAAAQLGVSRLTLKRARERGDIEYTLLGARMIRYTQAQLDQYLKRGQRREAAPAARQESRRVRAVPVAKPSKAAALAKARAILKRGAK